MKIGFDNDKYLSMQSEHIRERIKKFDNKLYLEFGGKLFDDYHASRVLPGFQPDSKLQMLLQLKDQAEVVIVISAEDIISNKIRGDYGITYDLDVLRLIDAFQDQAGETSLPIRSPDNRIPGNKGPRPCKAVPTNKEAPRVRASPEDGLTAKPSGFSLPVKAPDASGES